MSFHTANYDAYLFLGYPDAAPLWEWSVWKRVVPQLTPLMEMARGKPAARSHRYEGRKIGKPGRLSWNDASHQKWTHGSPLTSSASRAWEFGSYELWAPSWNVSVREDSAPDVFLKISNEAVR